MLSNFKTAVKADSRDLKPIMPISKVDGDILSELIAALDISGEKLLVSILEKYKQIPDVNFLKMLQKFNVNFEPMVEIDKENPPFKIMININKELFFDVRLINSIRKVDGYDDKENQPIYKLLINEDPSDKTIYCNTYIKFVSESQREMEWGTLKKKLERYNILFI